MIVLYFGTFFLTGGKGEDKEPEHQGAVGIAEETEADQEEDAAKQQSTLEFLKEKIVKISTELEAIEKLPKDSRPQERWEKLQRDFASAKEEKVLCMQ